MSEQTSLIEFPCNFPIKVMGVQHPEFQARILACIREHAPATTEADITVRPSSKGNYLGATVQLADIQNQEQLDNIYRALTGHELVKVVL
ncbi:DUF493 domain-containing protein [Neisseria leonii]|uniref:UPF0250 protein ORY91_000384 n=1 Tax=Neisseria leonii TaxID=2995413 RepID=A0A9X4E088_9NEIS|nr:MULTISPECIES: DUF493 domain-containing protein [unclassified Neisseria]MDD9325409.1 DUF493 domain-containing protein [Neisseria sp. 3986]MDD9327006.1 DUF493 domain-containing protein [Neisseria sp. 51.81]